MSTETPALAAHICHPDLMEEVTEAFLTEAEIQEQDLSVLWEHAAMCCNTLTDTLKGVTGFRASPALESAISALADLEIAANTALQRLQDEWPRARWIDSRNDLDYWLEAEAEEPGRKLAQEERKRAQAQELNHRHALPPKPADQPL